jgi:hypothetical protein
LYGFIAEQLKIIDLAADIKPCKLCMTRIFILQNLQAFVDDKIISD